MAVLLSKCSPLFGDPFWEQHTTVVEGCGARCLIVTQDEAKIDRTPVHTSLHEKTLHATQPVNLLVCAEKHHQ